LDCALLKILLHKDVLDYIVLNIIIRVFDQINEFFPCNLPLGSFDFRGSRYPFGLTETDFLLRFFLFGFALSGTWGTIAVGWGRGLGTVSTEMSFSLAIEALAFVHKVCVFFGGHAAGASMAWCCIHGIRITVSTFTVESLTPLVQILFLERGLVLFVIVDP